MTAAAPAFRRSPFLRGTKAWALDAVAMHDEFDELLAGLIDECGLVRLRQRAADLWRLDDPDVASYVSHLRTHTPEEWEAGFEERHVGEWYRILMADYLRPVTGFADPTQLKDGLPALGWTASEARRLAWGRELVELARTYALEETATALSIVLPVGNKGWLAIEDVRCYLDRFRAMNRRVFRRYQHLVPVVEDAYAVLERFASFPADHVVLLPGPTN
ncbi:MAG: hypothetical protein N2037_04440 [Acidimicrobiales bacterium]|nr:hypothetical protein [Acidimicrobiales bacterium]